MPNPTNPTVPLVDAIYVAAQAARIAAPDITRDDSTGITMIVLALPAASLPDALDIRRAVMHAAPGSAVGDDILNRPDLISFYMCGGQSVSFDRRIVHATGATR